MMGHLAAGIDSAEGSLDEFQETVLNFFWNISIDILSESLFFHLVKVVNCGLRADLEGKIET